MNQSVYDDYADGLGAILAVPGRVQGQLDQARDHYARAQTAAARIQKEAKDQNAGLQRHVSEVYGHAGQVLSASLSQDGVRALLPPPVAARVEGVTRESVAASERELDDAFAALRAAVEGSRREQEHEDVVNQHRRWLLVAAVVAAVIVILVVVVLIAT